MSVTREPTDLERLGIRRAPDPVPTVAPAHPSERKVVRAGYLAGRTGGAPSDCPHPLQRIDGRVVGRKAMLWIRGFVLGEAELANVRRSFVTAAAALDRPQRNAWGGSWGGG